MARLNSNKPKKCRNSGCQSEFLPFKSTDKYCSAKCYFADSKEQGKKIGIKKTSDKRTAELVVYTKNRRIYLEKPENKVCFIDGCNSRATTIEHIMGRVGYADDWARDNGISLFLDERYWRPCCLEHNLELERNPELSKKYQLSKIHKGKK